MFFIYFVSVLVILVHQIKLNKWKMFPWQLAEIKTFYILFCFKKLFYLLFYFVLNVPPDGFSFSFTFNINHNNPAMNLHTKFTIYLNLPYIIFSYCCLFLSI